MRAQCARVLPLLARSFDGVAIVASQDSDPAMLDDLRDASAVVHTDERRGVESLGISRRAALELGLKRADAGDIVFGDFDRFLHWADLWPDEFTATFGGGGARGPVVFGRTARAFATHPRVQRETEGPVSDLFARVSGHQWDTLAAARYLPRHAAVSILDECPEESVGTDTAWPLFLHRQGFDVTYVATEGLEFETADRHEVQVRAAGGVGAWLERMDRDPEVWAFRLRLAACEAAAMKPYATG
jgi:hypothetical protein